MNYALFADSGRADLKFYLMKSSINIDLLSYSCSREVLLEGKGQYSWPPCSDSLLYKKEKTENKAADIN